jgi:hypothetical protein
VVVAEECLPVLQEELDNGLGPVKHGVVQPCYHVLHRHGAAHMDQRALERDTHEDADRFMSVGSHSLD